jgi:molybdenum cofactor biosynthesis enzyme MoaA
MISDVTDDLPYKADILADQDCEDLYDSLRARLKRLIKDLTKNGATENHTEILEVASSEIYGVVSDYTLRTMYQCASCGRIYISGEGRQVHCFVPMEESVPKNLFRSKDGDNRKIDLRATLSKTMGGKIQWGGWGEPDSGVYWTNDPNELRQRYSEVFERLRYKNLLRHALLQIHDDLEHSWPPDEED